ncbi:MAG: hypothetical protein K2G08_02080 [Paramuribaculum sp.]|nr:hypothetical protein [Paramuribaculum sp.]
MKNTVKTITLTIDELNNIVNNSASGNVEAAKNFIATKIEEKAERLARQREQRRQRKQQKKKAASAFSENSEYSEHSESSEFSENSPKKVYLPLNKDLAKCILWFNNRRDALKSNMTRIIREIALSGGAPSTLKSIEEAMNLLLHICTEAAEAAHNHLHAKHYLRPATAQCTLHKQTQAK